MGVQCITLNGNWKEDNFLQSQSTFYTISSCECWLLHIYCKILNVIICIHFSLSNAMKITICACHLPYFPVLLIPSLSSSDSVVPCVIYLIRQDHRIIPMYIFVFYGPNRINEAGRRSLGHPTAQSRDRHVLRPGCSQLGPVVTSNPPRTEIAPLSE